MNNTARINAISAKIKNILSDESPVADYRAADRAYIADLIAERTALIAERGPAKSPWQAHTGVRACDTAFSR